MLYKSKARVSNAYNPSGGHYGVDIVGQGDKKIYSPVDGTVIACGNTDPNGWGINVQIKLNSNPKYRMVIGHFNKINVKSGQVIKKGDYLGDEGWTGYTIPSGSGGQHSHTEVRLVGGDRTTAISPLSYLGLTDGDNKVGTIIDFTKVNQTETATTVKKAEKTLVRQAQHTITATKTVSEDKLLAETTKLKTLGFKVSSKEVSAAVYEIKVTKPKKSVNDIAIEVVKGLWGNGEERRERLTEAGYDYGAVQGQVNRLV